MSNRESIPDLAARVASQKVTLNCLIYDLKTADDDGLWFALSSAENQANQAAETALYSALSQFADLIRITKDAIKQAEKGGKA